MKYENKYTQERYEAKKALAKELQTKLKGYDVQFIDTKEQDEREEIQIIGDFPIVISYNDYSKKYSLYLKSRDLPYIEHYAESQAREKYTKPNDIGVVTPSKIDAWILYLGSIYNDLVQLSNERQAKVKAFLQQAEKAGIPIKQNIREYSSESDKLLYNGSIVRNGIEYSFNIENGGYIRQEVKVHYSVGNTIEAFEQLSKNDYKSK